MACDTSPKPAKIQLKAARNTNSTAEKYFKNNCKRLWGKFCTSKNSEWLPSKKQGILFYFDQGILNTKNSWFCTNSTSLLPYSLYPLFDIDDMEDNECLAEFQVNKRDIPALAEALQIPDWISCNQRRKAEGTESLCMLLKRNQRFFTVLHNPRHSSAPAIWISSSLWGLKRKTWTLYLCISPAVRCVRHVLTASILRQTRKQKLKHIHSVKNSMLEKHSR